MFGGKRRKATDSVIERMRPLIGVLQHNGGIPPGFWDDEFVLGFMHLMIAFHMSQCAGNVSRTQRGMMIPDVYTALSNLNGQAIARRATEMVMETPQRPDFKQGGDYAHIVAVASIGKATEEGREIVEEAKAQAAAQGSPNDVGAVFAILMHRLYFQEVAERFDIELG